MNLFRLSINLLRRDWRAGEWRVLLLALVLAVGSLATVGLFADRVRLALQQEATSLIGADLRIVSARPLPPAYREMAEARGLRTVESRAFLSMVAHREETLLSEIQAVGAGYPLRGRIEIDDGAVVGRVHPRIIGDVPRFSQAELNPLVILRGQVQIKFAPSSQRGMIHHLVSFALIQLGFRRQSSTANTMTSSPATR